MLDQGRVRVSLEGHRDRGGEGGEGGGGSAGGERLAGEHGENGESAGARGRPEVLQIDTGAGGTGARADGGNSASRSNEAAGTGTVVVELERGALLVLSLRATPGVSARASWGLGLSGAVRVRFLAALGQAYVHARASSSVSG